ncbi:MAG TPA: TlpA disulfide reductase family protein [Actinomycetota bacterium]|nr:TlpA disulfide reductase family protein [Actinomycetota bacterium]
MAPTDAPSDENEISGPNAPRNRKRTRRVVAFLPALLLVGLLGYGALRPAAEPDRDAVTFSLPRLDGDGTLSSEDLTGTPVVLNFWASWCQPCKEEMPAFERVWKRYQGRIEIVGVNVRDSEIAARRFAEKVGVTYPLVVDAQEDLANSLHVVGLPQTFFLDGDLRVTGGHAGDRQLGAISEEDLTARIEDLLGS